MTERTTPRSIAAAVSIGILSLVLPLGLIGLAFSVALKGKPYPGIPGTEGRLYQGLLREGELWTSYCSFTMPPKSRLHRIDLETGADHDTGLEVDGDDCWVFQLDNTIYVRTNPHLYTTDGKSLTQIGPRWKWEADFFAMPFHDQGILTVVAKTNDGHYVLRRLIDGAWVDGKRIVLPGLGRAWEQTPQHEHRTLVPRSYTASVTTAAGTPVPTAGRSLMLFVIHWNDGCHLMVTDHSQFAAYREGFEFDDLSSDVSSALAPRDASGWQEIAPPQGDYGWSAMSCDRHGLLFSRNGAIVRRTADHRWVPVLNPSGQRGGGYYNVLAASSDDVAYIVDEDQCWGAASVRRIVNDKTDPIHLRIPGFRSEYLGRWKMVFCGLILATLLHVALLVTGATWATRQSRKILFEAGIRHALAASPSRRTVAFVADTVLLLAAGLSLLLLFTGVFELPPDLRLDEPHRDLLVLEQRLYQLCGGPPAAGVSPLLNSSEQLKAMIPGLVLALAASVGILWVIRAWVEGRTGITPGKWLFGLRTLRTTLQPCGPSRIIVRDILLCFDVPLLLTPLPAICSLILTDGQQRLGDLAADTIVVQSRSLRVAPRPGDPSQTY